MLHSAVLKPDFHLFLGQVQVCGDLDAPQSGEVHIRGELPLQLQKLRAGEGCAHALAALKFAVTVFCKKKNNNKTRAIVSNTLYYGNRCFVNTVERARQLLLTDGDAVELSRVWDRVCSLVYPRRVAEVDAVG